MKHHFGHHVGKIQLPCDICAGMGPLLGVVLVLDLFDLFWFLAISSNICPFLWDRYCVTLDRLLTT